MTDSYERMKAQKDAMTEAEAARKLVNLSKALLDDANAECRELRDLLKRFRDHVILNATRWQLGSMGSHHHPLWAEVNAALVDGSDESQAALRPDKVQPKGDE